MTHPQRCEMCRFHTSEMGYDDMIFCNFGGGKTAVYKPVLRFINVRGCASHSSAPVPEGYIITEEQLKAWRKGCLNLSNPHTDDDICKKCKCRGIKFRAKCCDFDDNEMEKIFRSHPYNEQSIRQDEREKVLEKAIQLQKDVESAFSKKTGEYNPTSICIVQRYVKELRREGKQEEK